MTDRELINALVKKGLTDLKDWGEPITEKRALVMKSIADAINCKIRTLENAKYSKEQILGADKSKLLKIHARDKGVIK